MNKEGTNEEVASREKDVQPTQSPKEKPKSMKFLYGCNGLNLIESVFENYNEVQVIGNNTVLINQRFAKEMNQAKKEAVNDLITFIKEIIYERIKNELINL